jgi:hypothetical protein
LSTTGGTSLSPSPYTTPEGGREERRGKEREEGKTEWKRDGMREWNWAREKEEGKSKRKKLD